MTVAVDTMQSNADLAPAVVKLVGHSGTVRCLCFHPTDDRLLLSGGVVDQDILVWNTDTGQLAGRLKGCQGGVFGLAAAGDAAYFCSVGKDKAVRLWDLRTSREVLSLVAEQFSDMNCVALNHGPTMLRQ
mmetsp:Transcript_28389/g.13138  ORF Transcript_28389/g.13138 Transcript_28389/m.13138 type:complete len:130 (+) Transcript_28389:111-500(+)